MKKVFCFITFSIFFSFGCFGDQNFININNLISEGHFEAFSKIELEDTSIVLIGKTKNKRIISSPDISYKHYYIGQIYILAIDNKNGLLKSYVSAELNGSAHECYFNENEFLIKPYSRSEIKGSREIILYDSKHNLFRIFTSEWMNINNFYISNEFIVSNLQNHPQYKYYIFNKHTGSQKPLKMLEKALKTEFQDSEKIFIKRNIYNYPY